MFAVSYDYVYVRPAGPQPFFLSDTTYLGGTNPTVAITAVEPGSLQDLLLDPVPGELFELAQTLPSVEVWSNNIKGTCETPLTPPPLSSTPWPSAITTPVAARPCTYFYSSILQAELSSATPLVVSTATTLSITGSGFSVLPRVQLVSLGDAAVVVECPVSNYTATSVQCVVGAGSSGLYTLHVVVGMCVCRGWGEGCVR